MPDSGHIHILLLVHSAKLVVGVIVVEEQSRHAAGQGGEAEESWPEASSTPAAAFRRLFDAVFVGRGSRLRSVAGDGVSWLACESELGGQVSGFTACSNWELCDSGSKVLPP